jgi:hypothetical protein
MKQKKHISFLKQIKIWLLAMLAVGGFFLDSSNGTGLSKDILVTAEIESTSADQEVPNDDVYLVSYEAIVPFFSANVSLDFFTIKQAPLLSEILHVDLPKVINFNDIFFQTLFRYIISTKAP